MSEGQGRGTVFVLYVLLLTENGIENLLRGCPSPDGKGARKSGRTCDEFLKGSDERDEERDAGDINELVRAYVR